MTKNQIANRNRTVTIGRIGGGSSCSLINMLPYDPRNLHDPRHPNHHSHSRSVVEGE